METICCARQFMNEQDRYILVAQVIEYGKYAYVIKDLQGAFVGQESEQITKIKEFIIQHNAIQDKQDACDVRIYEFIEVLPTVTLNITSQHLTTVNTMIERALIHYAPGYKKVLWL
jgi:hypothetical protein